MPQQHNHKHIFLLFQSFSDRELLNEAGKIQFAQKIAFKKDQRQVIQSVFGH